MAREGSGLSPRRLFDGVQGSGKLSYILALVLTLGCLTWWSSVAVRAEEEPAAEEKQPKEEGSDEASKEEEEGQPAPEEKEAEAADEETAPSEPDEAEEEGIKASESHRRGSSFRKPELPRASEIHRRNTGGRSRLEEETNHEESDGTVIAEDKAFDMAHFEKPPEEREYRFALDNVDFETLLKQWTRMTGLPVMGEPPSGKVSFVSSETLDYKGAFNRIRMLLFENKDTAHQNIADPYWMIRDGDVFKVTRMTELQRGYRPKEIYTSVEAFDAAGLEENDLALMLYTPASTEEVSLVRDFLPDYFRIAEFATTNSVTMFGLVRDIRKYLEYAQIFKGLNFDPRMRKKLPVDHITPTRAVELLEELMVNNQATGGGTAPKRPVRGDNKNEVPRESGPLPPTLLPFDEHKWILVLAMETKIAEIEGFLKLIDVPTPSDIDPVIISLRHAQAEELASLIFPLATETDAPRAETLESKEKRPLRKSGGGSHGSAELNIIPEPRTNSLVVIGDEEHVARVRKLVEIFDVRSDDVPRTIEILHVDPEQVVETVQAFMGTPRRGQKGGEEGFHITAAPTGNRVILRGNREDMDYAEQLIAQIDVAPDEGGPTLHQAKLVNAKAGTLADVLSKLDGLESGDSVPGGQSRDEGRRPKRQPRGDTGRFFGDDAGNTLFVMCTAADWDEKYWPLIQKFDGEAEESLPDTTLLRVTHISPQDAMTTLEQLFPRKERKEAGDDAVRFAVTNGGVLVTNARPGQVEKLREVLGQIDVDPLADVKLERKIFELQHADVEEVKEAIDTLVTSVSSGKGRSEGRGGRRNPRGGSPPEGASSVPAAAGDEVRISVIAGKKLVVSATADMLKEIEDLIVSLDVPETPAGETVIRTVKLNYADADELTTTISGMVAGKSPSPKPKQRRRPREGEGPGGSIDLGAGMNVTITTKPGKQALVLSGVKEEVDEVESWIRMLDDEQSGKSVLKVYRPARSDPKQLAETIMAFVDTGSGKGGGGKPARKETPKENSDPLGDLMEGFGELLNPEPPGPMIGKDIIIKVDPMEGTLLVQTSPANLRLVDQIVEMYEGSEGVSGELATDVLKPLMEYEMVRGKAQDAAYDLKETLEKYWNQPDILPVVAVDYDSLTNTLLVRCDEKYHDEIREIVAEHLDIADLTKEEAASETRLITGAAASEVALLLLEQVKGMEFDPAALDKLKDDELLKRLKPYVPGEEEETPKSPNADTPKSELQPCVLPMSLLRALHDGVVAQTSKETSKEDEDDESARQAIADSMFGPAPDDDKETPKTPPSPPLVRGGVEASSEPVKDDVPPADEVETPLRVVWDDKEGTIRFEGTKEKVDEAVKALDDILAKLKEATVKPDIRVYQLRYQDVDWAAQVLEAMFNLKKSTGRMTPQQLQQQQQQLKQLQQQQQQQGRQARPDQRPGQDQQAEQQQAQQAALQAAMAGQQGTSALYVLPNPRNQTLIIRAATEDYPMILELLATIDRPGDKPSDFRIFPLKKRRADDVEQTLNFVLGLDKSPSKARAPQAGQSGNPQQQAQQLQQQMMQLELEGMEGTSLSSSDQIKVTSDAVTNSVIVRAPKAVMPLIAELIEDIEGQPVPESVIKSYALEHADATELVAQLKELFPSGRVQGAPGGKRGAGKENGGGFDPTSVNAPTFLADTRGNRVIVKALDVDLPVIETEILALDIEVKDDQATIVPVKWLNPETTAKTLLDVYKERAGKGKGGGGSTVQIVGDSDSNTIFVRAPQQLREEILTQIAKMDTPEGSRPRLIHLTQATPTELVKIVDTVYGSGGGGGGRGPRGRRGGIVVTADDESAQLIVVAPDDVFEDVKKLVESLDSPEFVDRIGQITKVYALKYADADGVLQAVNSISGKGKNGRAPLKDRITAVVESSTQSLVVTASTENHEKVAKLIEQLDVDSGAVVREIYKMAEAQASEVAEIINSSIKQRGPQKRPQGQQLTVVPNDSTNSLVLHGTRKDLDNVLELVKALDLPPDQTAGRYPEVYTIKYADPMSTASAIKSAFPRGKGTAPAEVVDAEYASGTGSLVVTASKENHDKIVTLLGKIDIESTAKRTVHIVKLKEANAEDLAQKFQMFYKSIRREKQGGEIPMQVFGDPGTNSLVIYSTEDELSEIMTLLMTVDVQPDYLADRKIKSFKLDYAEAWALKEMIDEIFRSRGPQKASPKDTVAAMVDWGGNSIVVTASSDNMAQIEQLIKEVDRKDSGQRAVHVLRVEHTDAEAVNQALNDIYVKKGTTRRGAETISITNPRGTDSLLVKANETELVAIKQTLADLDLVTSSEVPQVITLIHVLPSQIAPTLQKMYVDDQRRGGRGASSGIEPVIEANDGSKTLLVKASTSDFNNIVELVKLLDVADNQIVGGIEIIPVQKGVDVTELAYNLVDLLKQAWEDDGKRTGVTRRATITPDVRTNSILLAGDSSRFAEVKTAIATLEKMSPMGGKSYRTIQLKGRDPAEVKKILDEIIKEKQSGGSRSRRR